METTQHIDRNPLTAYHYWLAAKFGDLCESSTSWNGHNISATGADKLERFLPGSGFLRLGAPALAAIRAGAALANVIAIECAQAISMRLHSLPVAILLSVVLFFIYFVLNDAKKCLLNLRLANLERAGAEIVPQARYNLGILGPLIGMITYVPYLFSFLWWVSSFSVIMGAYAK
jgi:hypothetical protein